MKNYPHLISKVYREPWCILPSKHQAIRSALEAHLAGMVSPADQERDEQEEPQQEGSQLIIPITGVIGQHLSGMEMDCGGYSLDTLADVLDVAEEDDSIEEIILNINSPGGTVTGVPEMAERIAQIDKKVIAFTDSQMCSAAYYLAAGADEIYCTKSADVGSIGVYAVYMDYSRNLANEGVVVNAISAGTDKLMGAWWKPMSEDEKAKIQASVDKIADGFRSHVTTFRDSVKLQSMQGQVFDGEDACLNGLCDSVIPSLSQLLR